MLHKNERVENSVTVERIDNNKRHSDSNVVLACHRCNSTRSDLYTHAEFYEKCFEIIKQ